MKFNDTAMEFLANEWETYGRDMDIDSDLEDIYDSLDRFMDMQGLHQTRWSDYSYGCQCHGLELAPDSEDHTPIPYDEKQVKIWSDYAILEPWNKHFNRLIELADVRDNAENDDDYYDAQSDYLEELDATLYDICRSIERYIQDAYDAAYDDSAFASFVDCFGQDLIRERVAHLRDCIIPKFSNEYTALILALNGC